MRIFLKLSIVSLLVLFNLSEDRVFGAQILFNASKDSIVVEEEFSVDISLDSERKSVNAIEGEVAFPQEFFEVKEIRDGSSIMNLWIQRPEINQGSIRFSGITPGGYNGDRGLLFTVIFKAKKIGKENLLAKNMQALQNDGNASKLPIGERTVSIIILPATESFPRMLPIEDTDKPEKFTGEIVQDDQIFEGRTFVVFATQDKGSGVGHYEVKEGFFGDYTVASSPYVLQDQSADKKIYIKALDKNGNSEISVLTPAKWKPWYKEYGGVFITALFVLLVFATYLERRKII